MMVEKQTNWGRTIYAVLDSNGKVLARCDEREIAHRIKDLLQANGK